MESEKLAVNTMDEAQSTYSNENYNDDDEEEEDGTGVAIAFAEEIQDERYYFRSFLPSKVGGKPAWLNPRDIPKPSQLKCTECKKPLKFLLQLYAPLNQFDRSYHRIIYIFICGQHKCCGKYGTLKVFRSQLPANNIFYDDNDNENDNENETELKIKEKEDLLLSELSKYETLRIEPYINIPNCIVCGHYGTFKCGGCKHIIINYCCKEHQKYHWHKQHRRYCKELKQLETEKELSECLNDYLFPTFEIVPDQEPLPITMDIKGLKINDDDGMTEKEKICKLMKEYKKNGDNHGYNEDDLKLLEQQMIKDFDSIYLKFQERIHRAPQQIIRYADGENNCNQNEMKNDNDNDNDEWPEPLWMGSQGIIDCNNDVPKCEQCGGDRKFEFQVMPQLLHILKQGVDDLDWGILAVFSCVNSCGDGNKQYFQEFIHYQPSYGAFEHRDDKGFIG